MPNLNEGTLLSAMETAGKSIEDDELREAMREKGLGTPATRAAIIEAAMEEFVARGFAATRLDDLRSPPGNRLEALKGDRRGQHSIRINQQWRVCFVWTPDGPEAVEIVDYH